MKKIKIFLAAFAAMFGLGMQAQTWTGNPVAEGSFYLYNVGAQKFLCGANSWGTQSSLDNVGFEVTIAESNTGYTISTSPTYNGKFLNLNNSTVPFVDAPSGVWSIIAVEGQTNTYKLKLGDNYLAYDGSSTALVFPAEEPTTGNGYWKLVTKEERIDALADATQGNPMDATFLIQDYNFSRETNKSVWTVVASNCSLATGPQGNNVAESWKSAFNVTQTATVPNGYYKFRAQAWIHEYTVTGSDFPVVFLNDAFKSFLQQETETASVSTVSDFFTNGDNGQYFYTDWTDLVTVSNKSITVGARGTRTDTWCVWDNFQIQYYGPLDLSTYVTELNAAVAAAEAYEDQLPAAVYANIASAITENNKTYDNEDDYTTAIQAINNAVSTYATDEIIADYARYNSIKAAALAISDDVDTAAADTEVEAATTTTAIDEAIVTLRAAFLAELPNVTIPDDPGYIDVTTVMVDNASVRQNTNYWTIANLSNPGWNSSAGVCNYNECEFYSRNFKFYQTLPLVPGTWEFGVTGFHRDGNHSTYFYAGEDKILIPGVANSIVDSMADAEKYFDAGNGKVNLKFLIETAEDVEIGIDNKDTETDKWTIFRDFTLKYYGAPDYSVYQDQWDAAVVAANVAKNDAANANVTGQELTDLNTAISNAPDGNSKKADYLAKINALTDATSAFIAAAPSYDAYVSAIAEAADEKAKADALSTSIYTTALGSTPNTAEEAAAKAASLINDIKVGEYNYVVDNYTTAIKLGEWTQEGGTKFNYGGQHWSGDNSQGYWEQTTENYSSSSWSISFNQTIELPAGNYVFKVAGRHSGSSEMALEVTNADTEAIIGSVNDFPTGDTGKGIATDGTANFTDGTFANNGNGRGWQWRYVPFTLAETTNVTVAVTASAAVQYQWISFCNYTVQAIPNAAVSIIAYNQALDEAKAARDNDAYANVTGSERDALLAAIEGDETLDKSDKDKIDAAKDELVSAMTAFINAKAAYDTFAEVKTKVYEELPYASSTKYAAIATVQEETTAATSAADAADKTNAILSAYRKYVESNALAEGVAGAEDKTSLISDPNMEVTYDGTAHTFGAWQVFDQTNGNIQLLSSESFTDGDGNSNYKYVDIYKNDNNAGIRQTLSNLAPGRYILTVTARAQATAGASFKVFAGSTSKEIERIGNSGGVFGRGWNDATLVFDVLTEGDVNIGVQSANGKNLWWSATRFRLARLGNVQVSIDENVDYAATEATSVDVTLARTIKADAWNTFVVPFDITNAELKAAFGNDVEVAEFSDGGASADAVTVSFTKMGTPAITANTPVLLKSSTAGTSYSFTNRSVVTGTTTIAGTYVDFVGTYNASTTITEGNYFISGNKLWKSSGATTINGTRAYIDAKNVASVRLFIDVVETGIEAINGVEAENGAIYNIAGQRLGKMQKGINIVNGKKIIK